MSYERLSAQDTVFLRIEDERQPQHVGSLSVYDADPWRDEHGRIDIEALRAFIAARAHRVPRLRQRLMEVPLGQGRPTSTSPTTSGSPPCPGPATRTSCSS
jgi:hypothetical protein